MPQSQKAAPIYDAIEALLKSVVPADCRIFQANMPLQMMDSLARETARLCTYLIFQDRIRQNSSGRTPVHDIILEVSFYGSLTDADQMAGDFNAAVIGNSVTSEGWNFILRPSQSVGRRDVWEPRIAVKREYLQLQGIAIEPQS